MEAGARSLPAIVSKPSTRTNVALTTGSRRDKGPNTRAAPRPTASSIGTVPIQNTAITPAPARVPPVLAATTTKVNNQPQGRRVVSKPTSNARTAAG